MENGEGGGDCNGDLARGGESYGVKTIREGQERAGKTVRPGDRGYGGVRGGVVEKIHC